MCNIAGYVGKKNAAPILIEMIKKQEGLNGGFFTGIAVHNGKNIEYRKKQGDSAVLLGKTDAAALFGNAGIMHSRTPDGGNDLWAHPFYVERDGVIEMCYVANGGLGLFRERRAEYNKIADRLVLGGFDIPCKLNLQSHKYNRISSGEAVHMSDVMCQLIYSKKTEGKTTSLAMAAAYAEMPGEIVGLAIERDFSDRIYFSRINKPMFVGFGSDGAYLATSPTAFPSSVGKYTLLPALSSGTVFADRVESLPYFDFKTHVAPIDDGAQNIAEALIVSLLNKGQATTRDVFSVLRAILPTDVLTQAEAIAYSALRSLLDQGKIAMRNTKWEKDGFAAPLVIFELI